MEEDFNRLIEIFNLSQEDKSKVLEEMFALTTAFFDRYKYVMRSGEEEEKKTAQKQMAILEEYLQAENSKTQESLGLSQGEIKELSLNPRNFTQKQWEFLQKVQTRLLEDKEVEASKKPPLEDKKKGKNSKKSSWLKS
ncbi:MAG: hypothetical protein JSR76_04325 [Verrucomicrobia bacterium]|nr:hypothetical protein [Verrucomicrobiota bacterium]